MKTKIKIQKNKGAAMMIVVFFFVFISLTILIGIITPVIREFKISSDNFSSKESYFIAESGIEDIMYRIKNNMETGIIGADRTLFLNDTYFPIPTEITDLGNGKKQIITTGEVNSNERKINLNLTTSVGTSFNYGVMVGQGGMYLDSGIVNGSVYANGPITASSSGSNLISGTAISANSPDAVANQTNGTGTPSYSVNFGNTNNTQDIAQSFSVSESAIGIPLSKIQLYIKKIGSPSNANIQIKDFSNVNSLVASGTLSASSVSSSYGWVDISFASNKILYPNKTYWIIIDNPNNSTTNYYNIAATTGNSYVNGNIQIGKWDSVPWNNLTPQSPDIYFTVYLGGVYGSIAGNSINNKLKIGTVSGTVQAHTVNYANATGNIYCKSGSGNNKTCIDQSDPTYIAYPVSEANITEWQNVASSGGTYNGTYNVGWAGATIGPKKIVGNLNVNGGGVLTITGTLWVTGNIVLSGGGLIKLASNYATDDGVIISDGTIVVSGGGRATGSGSAGSYLMLLSLNDTTEAIVISGGAGAVIAYAPYGTIRISGGASLKEATGYRMEIIGNSTITYESGLSNNNFTSGPSGSWSIDSWKESE